MDPTSPPARRSAERDPAVRWGLGDFFWVYFGGIVAGVVLAGIGHAAEGDRSGQVGSLAIGLSFLGQFGGEYVAALSAAQPLKLIDLTGDRRLAFQTHHR